MEISALIQNIGLYLGKNMVKLSNKYDVYNRIVQHEDSMLEQLAEIIADYSVIFSQYNCHLKVGRIWINAHTKEKSSFRLPFRNGYSCYAYCDVIRDGKVLCSYSSNGEADYYELSEIWNISSIENRFFGLKAILPAIGDNIDEEIKELLECVKHL